MYSNVGEPRVYESGDQKLPKMKGPDKSRLPEEYKGSPPKVEVDIENRDEREIGKVLQTFAKKEVDPEENRRTIKDPLAPALSHGHKPSRGAMIDAQLKAEEEEMLKEKSKRKEKSQSWVRG